MGTTIAMVVCFVLMGFLLLALLAGIGYAGVMASTLAIDELGGKSTVGKVFAAIFGFIGGCLCPIWWAICLAVHTS